ncbi:MAG: preprotein translocase subunit SecE [Patescibacteria group bacterium]|nr:preprotein translocase subunit SecE [Patescibacteria group bacterium]
MRKPLVTLTFKDDSIYYIINIINQSKNFVIVNLVKMIQKIIQYLKESKEELKKVVWPSKKETLNLTFLVIVISLGVAIFLGLIDRLLTIFLEKIFR